VIDYLRLVLGTAIVLLPGVAIARALGQRSVSAALAWAMGVVFVGLLLVFTLHSGLWPALVILLAACGAAFAPRRAGESRAPGLA
jgi:hypothetical protein